MVRRKFRKEEGNRAVQDFQERENLLIEEIRNAQPTYIFLGI